MIFFYDLIAIIRKMTKLLTPAYFAKNTCLFKDNFIEEIPADIQLCIMKKVEELDKQEWERKREIEEIIADDLGITGDDVEYDKRCNAFSDILWSLKYTIDDDDDDEIYISKLKKLIDENIAYQNQLDIERIIEYIGVMNLIKEVAKSGIDITKYSTEELYIKCYYVYMLNHFKIYYTCDDIKIIQKFNLNVLVNELV
jgi:hypothetical protein